MYGHRISAAASDHSAIVDTTNAHTYTFTYVCICMSVVISIQPSALARCENIQLKDI